MSRINLIIEHISLIYRGEGGWLNKIKRGEGREGYFCNYKLISFNKRKKCVKKKNRIWIFRITMLNVEKQKSDYENEKHGWNTNERSEILVRKNNNNMRNIITLQKEI